MTAQTEHGERDERFGRLEAEGDASDEAQLGVH